MHNLCNIFCLMTPVHTYHCITKWFILVLGLCNVFKVLSTNSYVLVCILYVTVYHICYLLFYLIVQWPFVFCESRLLYNIILVVLYCRVCNICWSWYLVHWKFCNCISCFCSNTCKVHWTILLHSIQYTYTCITKDTCQVGQAKLRDF